MEALIQDIRYGIRRLARSPGFTGLAVLVLALGIGGTATAFGVVNAVLLRPLGFPDPGALVRPYSLWRGSRSTASPPDFADWRARSRSFTELAASNSGSFALTGDGPAEQIPGAQVTGGYFTVLGTPPLLGRTLTTADDDPGAAPGVVLGYDLWRRRFDADSGVVGGTVRLAGTSTTVLGVMPAGFVYPDGSELWLPLRFTADQMATQRGAHYLDVVGRLQRGVTLDANAAINRSRTRLAIGMGTSALSAAARSRRLSFSPRGNLKPAGSNLSEAIMLP